MWGEVTPAERLRSVTNGSIKRLPIRRRLC